MGLGAWVGGLACSFAAGEADAVEEGAPRPFAVEGGAGAAARSGLGDASLFGALARLGTGDLSAALGAAAARSGITRPVGASERPGRGAGAGSLGAGLARSARAGAPRAGSLGGAAEGSGLREASRAGSLGGPSDGSGPRGASRAGSLGGASGSAGERDASRAGSATDESSGDRASAWPDALAVGRDEALRSRAETRATTITLPALSSATTPIASFSADVEIPGLATAGRGSRRGPGAGASPDRATFGRGRGGSATAAFPV